MPETDSYMTILENIFGKKKSTDISSLVAQEVDKIFSALSKRRFRLSEDIYSPYVLIPISLLFSTPSVRYSSLSTFLPAALLG